MARKRKTGYSREEWRSKFAEAAKWCKVHRHELGMKQNECVAYALRHGL